MEGDERKGLEGNIWKFYVFQILSALTFFVPVIVLFWQENGLNLTQIMILQSLYSLAVVALEVPTGYFADVFGRRKSLILSGAFITLGVFAYSLGFSFYQFLIAEILWGVGVALLSGADSALVFDTLKDLGEENRYKKIMGNGVFYYLVATSAASVIGALIGKIDFRWTFFAMLPFMLLLIPVSFSLREPRRHKLIFERGYLLELFRTLKRSVIGNEKIRWLIVYSAVIMGFNTAVLWLYQPYFLMTGMDLAYFGVVFAAFNGVAALCSKYAHRIEEGLGQRHSLIMLIILMGCSYLLMGNFVLLFSFSFAFIQQFVRGFSKPVITDYINKLTSSDVRATVLSAQNLVGRLFYALIIPVIGWAADVYSITQALSIMGITSLVAGLIILLLLHRDNVI